MTADGKPIPKIPSNDELPAIRASAEWEEAKIADARGIQYDDWYKIPRALRSAYIARERLQARIDYWYPRWQRGEGLPEVTITPG